MCFDASQSIIVYPSDNLAAETNVTKIQPLMKKIPQLNQELSKPRSYRSDRYKFSNLVSYFQGAGTKVVSKSCKIAIGDEIDQFPVIQNLNNVHELDKRRRSYEDSILFLVCTPSYENGRIWQSFLKGSQGYWYLRCEGCNRLSMRSCDISNLQFESSYNEDLKEYIVIEGSERLVCPICGYQHTEASKAYMNQHGAYIHKIEERRKTHPSYQVGALASQLKSLSWSVIAQAQLAAGKRSDIESQMLLDNSFKGLPYKRRTVVKEDFDKIKDHCWKPSEAPSIDNIEIVFVTGDTQDESEFITVMAIDVNDNMYILYETEVKYLALTDDERTKINSTLEKPVETLEDIIYREYLVRDGIGIKPSFVLLDRQGHHSNEIQAFINKNSIVFGYQGTSMSLQKFKMSDTNRRLFLCSAKQYQVDLIYYLYSQKKRGNNYLYFRPTISDEFINHILAVKPDDSKKFGSNPENWTNIHGAADHFFDCIKMAYCAKEIMLSLFKYQRWRFGKAPSVLRRWQPVLDKQNLEKSIKPTIDTEKWFDV